MKPTARRLVLLFVLIGLVASGYALDVHYHLLTQPGYASPCDVNATVSCSSVYLSAYGSVYGVPVALFGLIWFVFVAILAAGGTWGPPTLRESFPGYLFATATVGLAVILYLGYAAFFILKAVCIFCLITYAAVIGLFLVAGIATPFPMTTLPRRTLTDLKTLVTRPLALAVALVFLAGAASALAFFPRESASRLQATPAVEPASQQAAADQQSEFERWFESQPRNTVPVSSNGGVVVIVKFSDYQCPSCAQSYFAYKPVLAKYEAEYPGAVTFVSKNFPLDTRCNPSLVRTVHPAGCDTAVAAVMAEKNGRGAAMEEWLYTNQQVVTPMVVRQAASTVGGVANWDAAAPTALEQVKADIALGRLLRVGVTPTFFINGVKIEGMIPPALFDTAISLELKKAGKLAK